METIIWALVVLAIALGIAAAIAGTIVYVFKYACFLIPMKFISNLWKEYCKKKSDKNEKK